MNASALLSKINFSVLRNIASVVLFRGGNILVQLILVPVSIKYVSKESYGLWITLSSMITWLNIMDVGLSYGLRNKLSEAMATDRKDLCQSYVSTTYFLLLLVGIGGCAMVSVVVYFLDWRTVLSIPKDLSYAQFILILVLIVASFFITFLLKPISAVCYATHKPFFDSLMTFLASFLNLVLIYAMTRFYAQGNLLVLAVVFCFTPILVNILFSGVLYRGIYKTFSPAYRYVHMQYARSLTSLSGKFFIIQIAATVVFTTDNFMISHYFGNEEVASYNIVQRYFSVPILLLNMILVPFWNLFTDAYIRQDKQWIRDTMTKLFMVSGLLCLGCMVMVSCSGFAYHLWLGNMMDIPLGITISVSVYTILLLVGSVLTTFINGTGKVKLQMTTSMLTSVLHIPLAMVAIKVFHMGVVGVVVASCVWLMLTLPLKFIQYRKLMAYGKPTLFTC